MKYQSLWWKCLAALLLLAVLLRLLCSADGIRLPRLFGAEGSGAALAAYDEAWLSGESAAPPSPSAQPSREASEPMPELTPLPGALLPDEAAALFPTERYLSLSRDAAQEEAERRSGLRKPGRGSGRSSGVLGFFFPDNR